MCVKTGKIVKTGETGKVVKTGETGKVVKTGETDRIVKTGKTGKTVERHGVSQGTFKTFQDLEVWQAARYQRPQAGTLALPARTQTKGITGRLNRRSA